ncbi:MAG: T9SS type A sorting domain-containing protein [Bacteroidia bacterium]|nr:T9SS type A sorting domain-containing protein [Bacteroidia bacterium]
MGTQQYFASKLEQPQKTTDAAQTDIGPLNKKDGWAWEYVIDLCNAVDMDLWINIPVSVDDNYITQLATLIKNRLEPNLNIYIEHTNELWNFGFLQYSWNKARAVEEVNAGGVNYNYDGSTDQEVWNQRRHAKRLRDAVQIFGNVFGSGTINTRIRGILAGVTPDPNGFFVAGRLPGMLSYLQANYGDPKNYIYAVSVPLYYGGEAASGGGNTGSYSVQQIIDAMRAASDAQRTERQSVVTLASQYQLPGGFISYEGGPDIGGGSTTNIGNRIRAIRDPQQADVYKRNFADNFWDLGGTMAMQFALQSSYSRYGAWGLTDDITLPDRNALFQAARDLIGSGGGSNNYRNPENPANTVNGLDYSYYEGIWSNLPDFNTLTPAETGNINNFDLSVRNRDDQFGFQFTGYVDVPTDGEYTFYTSSDDGSKLYIGTTEVVNNDGLHGSQERSGTIGLKAGKHALRVVFFENTGGEVLTVSYQGPGISKQAIPNSALYRVSGGSTGLSAVYFNNQTLTAPIALTRTDATVNFDWQSGSPGSGVNADNFSVRWTGQVEAPVNGNYTFYTLSDDGVRLWVNGNLVIDNWTDHPPTQNSSAAISLTGGQKYSIQMEFYENGGGAVAQLLWGYPGQSQQVIPQARLYPSSGGSQATVAASNPLERAIVFPNPTAEQLQVTLPAQEKPVLLEVWVTDASGKVWKSGRGTSSIINISDLPEGVYYIRITEGEHTTIRLVKIER